MFHFRLNPSPPTSAGLVTRGQAVDSLSLIHILERWPQQLVETLLPRVWQIIQEVARRWQEKVENFFHDPSVTEKMAIVWGGEVRMANPVSYTHLSGRCCSICTSPEATGAWTCL